MEYFVVWTVVSTLLLTSTVAIRKEDFSPLQLYDDLFTNHSKYIKPRLNNSEQVDVTFILSYATLVDLDSLKQEMISMMYINLLWTDEFLQWDPSSYENVSAINVDVDDVWAPRVIMTNELTDAQVMSSGEKKIYLTSQGHMTWSVTVTTHTHCELDMTYFPFDRQSCWLRFYVIQPDSEVTVSHFSFEYNHNVMKNGEFEYGEIGEWKERGYILGKWHYTLHGNIKLARRPFFFLINIILPVVMLSLLSNTVFLISAESGDKVNFALTVLLAQTVYLSFISTMMPKTSDEIPFLTLYMAALLVMNTLSVLASLLVMDVYKKSTTQANIKPGKLYVLLFRVLSSCMSSKLRQRSTTSDEKSNLSKESGGEVLEPQNRLNNNWSLEKQKKTDTIHALFSDNGFDEHLHVFDGIGGTSRDGITTFSNSLDMNYIHTDIGEGETIPDTKQGMVSKDTPTTVTVRETFRGMKGFAFFNKEEEDIVEHYKHNSSRSNVFLDDAPASDDQKEDKRHNRDTNVHSVYHDCVTDLDSGKTMENGQCPQKTGHFEVGEMSTKKDTGSPYNNKTALRENPTINFADGTNINDNNTKRSTDPLFQTVKFQAETGDTFPLRNIGSHKIWLPRPSTGSSDYGKTNSTSAKKFQDEDKDLYPSTTWLDISKTLDKVFFIFFTCILVVLTALFFVLTRMFR